MTTYYPSTSRPEQIIDPDTGLLLSGGTIEAYLAGTSTATNMFTDDAGTSAGDTITLNSGGFPEVSGNIVVIWLQSSVSYKFVLKDAAGTTIYTADNISDIFTVTGMTPSRDSLSSLLSDPPSTDAVYVTSYYGGWAASVAGPKGGHYRHKTGATNTSPTVGSAVSVSTIGTGTQAGYCWDANGDEWKISRQGEKDVLDAFQLGARGNDSADDTTALTDLLSFAGELSISDGTFITDPLQISSNTSLHLSNDTVLKENTGYGSTDCILNLGLATNPGTGNQVSNIHIYGSGALLQGLGATDSEFRMGVRMQEAKDVYIYNLRVTRMSGDGFYLGAGGNNALNFNENINLVDCEADDCNRQGCSLISYKGVNIIRFKGHNTGQTSPSTNGPWAGIDLEPNADHFPCEGLKIIEPDCRNNVGAGVLLHLRQFDESQTSDRVVDVQIDNPQLHGNGEANLRITSFFRNAGLITINNPVLHDATGWGLLMGNINQKTRVIINSPEFKNNAQSSTAGDYVFPGDSNASARQCQMLLYTNSIVAYDSDNGGLGIIQGNIEINDPVFISDTVDVKPWHMESYAGTTGSNYGFQRNININRPRIYRESGLSAIGTRTYNVNEGPNDVWVNDAKQYDHSAYNYVPIDSAKTTNYTVTNDDQDVELTNEGAAGTVRFTLPAAQGADYNAQHFTFRVVESFDLEIIGAGNDDISYSGGTRLPDAGTPEFIKSAVPGSKITLKKVNSSNWIAVLEEGYWEAAT